MIDIKQLAKVGAHFGHQTSRRNPKMSLYIWGQRSGVHLIDLSKTAAQAEKAAEFLQSVAAEGKQILWVGTKKQAHAAIAETGKNLKMPNVTHRWIGGTLTNNSQVRKSITKMLHFEDILEKSKQFSYTKKELNLFQKLADRLQHNVGGIRQLRWPVGAIVLVDVKKEQTALKEAVCTGVPVVALVDTNSDPSLVNYVIPCNDDSPKAIKLVVDYLAQAAQKGAAVAAQKKIDAAEQDRLQDTVEPLTISLEDEEETEARRKAKAAKAQTQRPRRETRN